MLKVELNVDYKASNACEVSRVGFIVLFPPCVFEEPLGNVLWTPLIEEVFGEFPKSSSRILCLSRHDGSLVLMWRAVARPPWCRQGATKVDDEGRLFTEGEERDEEEAG